MAAHNSDASGLSQAAVVDTELTAYQLTLRGMRLPVWAHYIFNALSAGSFLLLGHPMLAAISFIASCGVDTLQQGLLKRWMATSQSADETKGFTNLALLCIARSVAYTAPTFAMVMVGGLAEFAVFAFQITALFLVAMGGGGLSRKVFWALAGPILVECVALTVLKFEPAAAAAVGLGLFTLVVIMTAMCESLVRAIATWHAAFLANVAMVDDLAAARDCARAANSAKSNFLATMSHEIRTPMNGVLGMAQLLKRGTNDPVQIERIDVLIDSGEYLLAILNDILDVSKIDAGKLELVAAPEDLHVLLERLVSFWGARAQEKGVALGLHVSLDTPQHVMVDALRLRQVLFNLVGNALKFTEAGSVEILADARHEGEGAVVLTLSVRDTGPGIAEQYLPNLFDRFSQGEDADARRFGGTGLGLAIVRQLVELMEGRVWVESELGQGSTFHVEIPVEVVLSPAEEAAAPVETTAIAGLRLLAVDDNAVNLLVLEQLLSSLGHDVVQADSGAAALEAMAVEPFDLILTDIQMPGMTGTELLHQLRATPGPNQHAPVVALTADVTSGGRQRYLDEGFTDHTAKPIQLADLLDAMTRALDAEPVEAVYNGASNVSR